MHYTAPEAPRALAYFDLSKVPGFAQRAYARMARASADALHRGDHEAYFNIDDRKDALWTKIARDCVRWGRWNRHATADDKRLVALMVGMDGDEFLREID